MKGEEQSERVPHGQPPYSQDPCRAAPRSHRGFARFALQNLRECTDFAQMLQLPTPRRVQLGGLGVLADALKSERASDTQLES